MPEKSANQEEENDPLIGSVWEERFQIISLLGQGAFSRVYKARHLLLDSTVALKILNKDLPVSDKQRLRFQGEANLLKTFNHPNIVGLLSYGQSSKGQDYMVLEYVDGQTLQTLLKERGHLSQSEAIPVFASLCRALAYAHEKGILHRDIKPANVLISGKGEITTRIARLLDFGIFKDFESREQSQTQSGEILGSSNYMSPEQCTNKDLSPRSDLYSLGCLFYETLVGKPPMDDASDLAIMSNQINKEIRDLPANSGISKSLREIVLKCLEKDPERRPSSADAVLMQLEKAAKELEKIPTMPKLNLVILLGSILATVLLIITLSQSKTSSSTKENKAYLVQYRGAKLRETEHTAEGLKKLEQWLEANLKSNNPDYASLVIGLGQELSIRKDLQLPIKSRFAEEIERQLLQKLEAGIVSEKQRYKLRELLASTYELDSKPKEAEETLISLIAMHPGKQEESAETESVRLSELYGKLAQLNPKKEYLLKALPAMEANLGHYTHQGYQLASLKNLLLQAEIYSKTGNLIKARERMVQAGTFAKTLPFEEKTRDLRAQLLAKFLTQLNEIGPAEQVLDNYQPILAAMRQDKGQEHQYLLAQMQVAKALQACHKKAAADKVLENLVNSELFTKKRELNEADFLTCLQALHLLKRDSDISSELESFLQAKELQDKSLYLETLRLILSETKKLKFDSSGLFERISRALESNYGTDNQRGLLACSYAHALRERNRAQEALSNYQKAANLLEKSSADSSAFCGLYAGMSLAFLQLGDTDRALSAILRAEKESARSGDRNANFLVLLIKGQVLRGKHKWNEAIKTHTELVEKQMKERSAGIAWSIHELLQDYYESGKTEQFAKLFPGYFPALKELASKEEINQLLEAAIDGCRQQGKISAASELEALKLQNNRGPGTGTAPRKAALNQALPGSSAMDSVSSASRAA